MRTRSSAISAVAAASVEESNTDKMVSTTEDLKPSDDADESEKKPESNADGRTTKNEDVIPSLEADGSEEKLKSNADGTTKDADMILSQKADGSEEKLKPNANEGTIMSTEYDEKVESRSCDETTENADEIPSHKADKCQETLESNADNATTMNVNVMPSHASDEKVELRSGSGAIVNAEEIPSQKNDLSYLKMGTTADEKTADNVNVMPTHASADSSIKAQARSCDETAISADVISSHNAESEEKLELSAEDSTAMDVNVVPNQTSAEYDETLLSYNEDMLSIPEKDVIDCSTSDMDFTADSPIQSDIEINYSVKTIDDGSSLKLREPFLSEHDMTAEGKNAFRKDFNDKLNEFRIIGKKFCEDKKLPFPKSRIFNQIAFFLYRKNKLDVQNLELELTANPQWLAAKKANTDGKIKGTKTKYSEIFKIDTQPTNSTLDLDFTADSPIQDDAATTDSEGVQLKGTVDSSKKSTDDATGGKQEGAKGGEVSSSSEIDDLKQSAKIIATYNVDKLDAKENKKIGQQHCISKALTFPTSKRFVIILEELFEKEQLNEESLKVALEKDAEAAKRGEVPFVKLGEYCSSHKTYEAEQLKKFETIANKFCEDQKIPIPSCPDLKFIMDDLFSNGNLEEKTLQLRLMQYALANLSLAQKAEVVPKKIVPSPNVQKVVPPPNVLPSVVKPLQDMTEEEKTEYKPAAKSIAPNYNRLRVKVYKKIGQQHCISKALTFPTNKRFITVLEELFEKGQLNEKSLKVALEKDAQAAKRGEVPFVKLGEYCESYKTYKAEQLKKFEVIAKKICEDKKILIPSCADLKFIMDDLFSTGKLEEKTLQLRLMEHDALAKWTKAQKAKVAPKKMFCPPNVQKVGPPPEILPSFVKPFEDMTEEERKEFRTKLGFLKNELKPIVVKHCHKIKAPFPPSKDYYSICRHLLTAGMLDEENIKIAVEMNFEDRCNKRPPLTTEKIDLIIKHYRADNQINKRVMRAEVLKRIPAELFTLKHYWNLMHKEKKTNLFWNGEYNPDAAKYSHLKPTTLGAANTKSNQSKFGGPQTSQRPQVRGGFVSDSQRDQVKAMNLPWSKAEPEAGSLSVPKHYNIMKGGGKRKFDEDPEFQQSLTQLVAKSQLLEELGRQNRNFTESDVTRKTTFTELRHTKFNMRGYKQGQPPLPPKTPSRQFEPSGSGVSSFGARDAMSIKKHYQSPSFGEHSRNLEDGNFEPSRQFVPSGSGVSRFGARDAMSIKKHSQSPSFGEHSRNLEDGNFEPSRQFGPSGSGVSRFVSRDAMAIKEHSQSSSFGKHSRNLEDGNFAPSRQFGPSGSGVSRFGSRDVVAIEEHSQSSSFGKHSRNLEDRNSQPSRQFGPSGSGVSGFGARDVMAIKEHSQSSSFGEHSRNLENGNFEHSRQFPRSGVSSFGARATMTIKEHSQSSSFGEHTRNQEDGLSKRFQYSTIFDLKQGTSNQRESDRFNPPKRNQNDGFISPRENEGHPDDLRHKVNELKRVSRRMESSIPPPPIVPARFDELLRNRHDMSESRNDGDKRYSISDRLPSLTDLPPPPPMLSTRPAESKILQQNTGVTDWRYAKRQPPKKKSRYDEDRPAKSGQSESQPRVMDDFDSWMAFKPGPSQHQPPAPSRFDQSSSRNYNKPSPIGVEEWRYTREQTPPRKKSRFDEDRHPRTRQPKDLHRVMDEFEDWMDKNTRSSVDFSRKGDVVSSKGRGASGISMVKTNPPMIEFGKICKVAIVHETYPGDRITTEEAVSIRDALLDRIGVKRGVAPRFSDTYEEGGAVVLECEDQLTVTWLWVNASTIMPWRGAKLKPISWEKPLIEITLEVPKMMERQTPDTICERLMSQNPGLSTKLWKFKHSELSSKGLNLIFQIDDKSKESLESLGFKAYLGFSRVNVYILA